MHLLNFRSPISCIILIALFWCLGCAGHPKFTSSSDCYSSGVNSLINRMEWDANQVIVNKSVVEFNYYASLFADTISSITNLSVDSLILFKPEQDAVQEIKANSGSHTLFLSSTKNGYYFIEQVGDYTGRSRPQFGSGDLYLIKCDGDQSSIVFEKSISYN